jgi:hypothetical protein
VFEEIQAILKIIRKKQFDQNAELKEIIQMLQQCFKESNQTYNCVVKTVTEVVELGSYKNTRTEAYT